MTYVELEVGSHLTSQKMCRSTRYKTSSPGMSRTGLQNGSAGGGEGVCEILLLFLVFQAQVLAPPRGWNWPERSGE